MEELNVPQIESTIGSLRYVRKVNEENGCNKSPSSSSGGSNSFSEYLQQTGIVTNGTTSKSASTKQTDITPDDDRISTNIDPSSTTCWLPVVYHSDDGTQFEDFLLGMLTLPSEHRPALIIDTGGHFEEYREPKLLDGVWIASHRLNSRTYFQHKLTLSYDEHHIESTRSVPKVENVEFLSVPLSPLPEEVKDEIYRSEILALREAADEALKNNPVVGYSDYMPITRDSSKYRPCKSGECVSFHMGQCY